MRLSRRWILGGSALIALACGGGGASDDLVARGRTVYGNVCTTCHNADPRLAGTVGPALAGSSRELLAAKVLRGEYPPGHAPKAPSQLMPKFPYLEDSIDALAAYLASVGDEAPTGSP